MKKKSAKRSASKSELISDSHATGIEGLLSDLRAVIDESRQNALRAVDVIQVRTCWLVGRHIVAFEQDGAARAAYGRGLLTAISERLTVDFGRGFDASNLRYMRLFFQAFPICDALRHELSWTHYRSLLRVEDTAARTWYMNEAADQHWNTRALDRQIGTLYFERLLASTVGIILCAQKDHTVVRYSVLHGNEQLFASRYRLILPSEDELRAELIREQELLGQRLALQVEPSRKPLKRQSKKKGGQP